VAKNILWASIGAFVGLVLVSQAVILFFGKGGLMPDDRTPDACGIYIGIPLGAYLGWRIGPSVLSGLYQCLKRLMGQRWQ
jgi:hypothetical protein